MGAFSVFKSEPASMVVWPVELLILVGHELSEL